MATNSLVYAEAIEYFQSFATYPQVQAELRGILHDQVKRLYPMYAVCEQYATLRRTLRETRVQVLSQASRAHRDMRRRLMVRLCRPPISSH